MRHDLIGFAPDIDPATPGVLLDCDALIPTIKGMSAANSPNPTNFPALAAAPTNAYVSHLLDGTKRFFAATASAIYEGITNNWTDRSRSGGYSGSERMRFATFGNVTLATNLTEAIQQANISTGFTDIATAPKAMVLVPASGFVVALRINGMSQGDAPDGWGCSAIRDHTDWTPAASTQCVAGRLLDSPGPITAGAALGGDVVAYKATSMYVGRYVGPPIVWQWTRVPGDIGTPGPECVVVVGTRHFFIGNDDIYVFDGTVPRPIGAPVRNWFFERLSGTFRHLIFGVSDVARDLVYWYYPSSASQNGELDSVLVYNVRTERWGHWSVGVQVPVTYSSSGDTYDTFYGTAKYDELPDIAYDSPFWLSDVTVPGVFIGDNLYSLTGTPGASMWATGDLGDLTALSLLRRLTPRYLRAPDSAAMVNSYRMLSGDVNVNDATAPLTRGRFDVLRSARWHRARVTQQGAALVNGFDADLLPAGAE